MTRAWTAFCIVLLKSFKIVSMVRALATLQLLLVSPTRQQLAGGSRPGPAKEDERRQPSEWPAPVAPPTT